MDLSRQRQRLVDMLDELTESETSREDSKASIRDYHHELTVFDNHPADMGTEDYMRNLDAAIRENDNQRIELIQEAISRIDNGTYGKCSSCGHQINEDRLEALPWAGTCSDCAEDVSELGGMGKEPTAQAFKGDPTWPRFNQYGTSDSIQEQPSPDMDADDI